MPRQAKPPPRSPGDRTLVVDNGSYSIKAGFVTDELNPEADCHIIPNCIARSNEGGRGGNGIFVADQLDQCTNTGEMAFRRPMEKGFIVSWDGEMDIWKQTFFRDGAALYCDPHDTALIITEAPNCPRALQIHTDEILFEELEFASTYRCLGPALNAWNDIPALTGDPPSQSLPAECVLVVDSGYSHTTVTPLLYGRPVQQAIRRLDIGGKLMTNVLKELSSLRHWNLMDDSYLVSQIKEDVCYTSQDFHSDLQRVWDLRGPKGRPQALRAGIICEYILPDYNHTFRGHVKEDLGNVAPAVADETSLPLGNERFVVPELLFSPADIGMNQAGLPETIIQSLRCLPTAVWPGMLANIVVVGGNAKIPGLVDRLRTELRALTPSDCKLRVASPNDPTTFTWLGGARLAGDRDRLASAVVTRQEYEENGGQWTARRFAYGPK